LSGRFYLSPSRLYSCIRLNADKQTYDVPIPGDWVTIAVVADIGEVKYTKPPVGLGPDEDEIKRSKKHGTGKGKAKEQSQEENPTKTGAKRYINIRLVDFGARSGGSETGGTSIIRGDAFLSLLLFESDRFEWLEPGDDEPRGKSKKKVKVYKGGSKGAFEAMHKIRQGDVIALLNPRVLKPFQVSCRLCIIIDLLLT
jgi:minichromosome maintenance protein 10